MAQELKQTIRKLAKGAKGEKPSVDVSPGCPFGAVMDERIKEIERGIGELKSRLYGLIFLVIAGVVVEIITRLLG